MIASEGSLIRVLSGKVVGMGSVFVGEALQPQCAQEGRG